MVTNLNSEQILTISQNEVDIREASGPQVVFSTQYPFAKLDKTNSVSFQNINLLFITEPPNPSAGNTTSTLVYSFAHGYNYVPSTWFLMQNPNSDGNADKDPPYTQEGGVIFAADAADYAILNMTADKTNINFYVFKAYSGLTLPNIIGTTLLIRIYVFAGDLTGTAAGS